MRTLGSPVNDRPSEVSVTVEFDDSVLVDETNDPDLSERSTPTDGPATGAMSACPWSGPSICVG